MPHLPPAHHKTSKRDSLNEIKIKEKQNKTVLDSNLNIAKSMTHHNQTKEPTTWFLSILMWCITQEEGYDLLAEVHGGECRNHASSCTLVGKAFQHKFYWPIALQDTVELVKTSMACQFHAKQIHTPVQMLQMIPPSWPFAVWGLDIVGPFLCSIRGYQFPYAAIDKFTKWLEATPVVKINKQSALKFIKSMIYRFGVPNRIITDNGS
jgi:hypothetical protein